MVCFCFLFENGIATPNAEQFGDKQQKTKIQNQKVKKKK